jgi:hypothetical protein
VLDGAGDRSLPVVGAEHRVAAAGQDGPNEPLRAFVIINDQYSGCVIVCGH